MKYIIEDNYGDRKTHTSLQAIKEILKNPPSHWESGGGDSAINLIRNSACLIFFKIPEGIYIENLPQHTAPLFVAGQEAKPLTHYVGGEPMDVPDVCLCDEETAYAIMSYFVENGGALHPDYEWVNIYDYIADRYEE